MQVARYEYMAERILEYWARKYSEEFKRGDDYKVAKRTVCILITCFDMVQLKEITKFHTIWNIREEEYTNIILTDKLEFHIINLKKLENRIERLNIRDKELLKWCKFISSPEKLEANIMGENKNIEKAKQILERMSQDEQERDMAYRRERAIRDQNAIRASGYNEGKEEGRIEEKREIAKNMIKRGMSIDDIIEITGISQSELEELKK